MSRHKYFEDIENKSFEHPSKWGNLINDTRQKTWYNERRKYGFDSRETWNLNYVFICIIYERLKMYNEYTDNKIDKTFHHYEWKNKDYTFQQLINIVLDKCIFYLKNSDSDNAYELAKDIFEILGIIFPSLWW